MRSFSPVTLLVLIAVGSVAASSFIFMKILVEEISPSEIVAGRVFFGALALFAIILVERTPMNLSRGHISRVLLFATLETVIPFTLIATAEQKLDGGLAAVLISSMPLFTVLFAKLTPTDEGLSTVGFVGLGAGFLGVLVLSGIGTDALVSGDALSRLAVLAAGASYAAAGVYARLMLNTENALSVSGLQLGLATLLALPLVFVSNGTPSFGLSLSGWGALLALGFIGSGGMLFGFLWLVGKTGSIGASLVTYVVPFMGVFLGWALLDESINRQTWVGLILVLIGVSLTTYGGVRAAAPNQSSRNSQVLILEAENSI